MTGDVSKQYSQLEPIERFRLVLAASDRDDDGELAKLKRSGERLQYTVSDDFPYTQAFLSLAHVAFMDVLEEAAGFRDLLDHACQAKDGNDEGDDIPKHWKDVMFKGYVFRTKYQGWMRFCKGLGVPPLTLWRGYPGYYRLEGALKLSKMRSYVREGFARAVLGKQEITADELARCPLTPRTIAREWRGMYREMATRRGGV